jgi:uncharacterized membrane protein
MIWLPIAATIGNAMTSYSYNMALLLLMMIKCGYPIMLCSMR